MAFGDEGAAALPIWKPMERANPVAGPEATPAVTFGLRGETRHNGTRTATGTMVMEMVDLGPSKPDPRSFWQQRSIQLAMSLR